MAENVAANIADCARLIEAHYLRGPWALGEQFTLCDAYLALVPRWLTAAGVSLSDYPKLSAHWSCLRARPGAARVMALHGV